MASNKNWPYIVGAAGVAALAYLWLAPRLIKPGIGSNYYGIGGKAAPLPFVGDITSHLGGGGGHKAYPAMMPMMPHHAIVGMRNTNIVGEHGGTIPVGGGPAGVTGGGGDFMYPSGKIGHPGGYGVSGGYAGFEGSAARLSVA